jgi:histidinol phosphatase-like enzyme
MEEGFSAIEERPFVRREREGRSGRGVILDLDELCTSASGSAEVLDPHDLALPPGRGEILARYHAEGWQLLVRVWRPQVSRGLLGAEAVERTFNRLREILDFNFDTAYCPHDAGPPVCWCRGPLPGLVLEFAARHRVKLEASIVVGTGASDRTAAQRLKTTFTPVEQFFR